MFNCEKCETNLVVDYKLSAMYFNDNVTTLLNEDGDIDYNKLPRELVFVCRRCGFTKVISMEDIIRQHQDKIVKKLLVLRLDTVFKTADRSVVDEDHGIAYCGMCRGVIDDSGYCYNDVISQCVIRKAKLKKDDT